MHEIPDSPPDVPRTYDSVADARGNLAKYLTFYNAKRPQIGLISTRPNQSRLRHNNGSHSFMDAQKLSHHPEPLQYPCHHNASTAAHAQVRTALCRISLAIHARQQVFISDIQKLQRRHRALLRRLAQNRRLTVAHIIYRLQCLSAPRQFYAFHITSVLIFSYLR
jgi:hypothetical protein